MIACPTINAFHRVTVDHLVSGGARIAWELNPHFKELPISFQLQAGRTGLSTADDWVDVGAPQADVFFLTDPDQRLFGKVLRTHSRIKLTTLFGTHYSEPVGVLGHLTCRDWRIARDITRRELLRHRKFASERCHIFKAKVYGTPCTECVDILTEEVKNSACPTCYGTGFDPGYFPPLMDQYCELSQEARNEHRDLDARGMVNPMVIPARFLGFPQLETEDVIVHASSDRRYYVHAVKNLAEIRGVPIICEVELRLLPLTSILYSLPLTS